MNAYLPTILAALLIAGCSDSKQHAATSSNSEPSAKEAAVSAPTKPIAEEKARVIEYLTSGKEPAIKDATWTSDTILKIGVLDNGKSRDGYAAYICTVLHDQGIKDPVWIQIIDIEKVLSEKSFVKIGETECKFDPSPATTVEFPVNK